MFKRVTAGVAVGLTVAALATAAPATAESTTPTDGGVAVRVVCDAWIQGGTWDTVDVADRLWSYEEITVTIEGQEVGCDPAGGGESMLVHVPSRGPIAFTASATFPGDPGQPSALLQPGSVWMPAFTNACKGVSVDGEDVLVCPRLWVMVGGAYPYWTDNLNAL